MTFDKNKVTGIGDDKILEDIRKDNGFSFEDKCELIRSDVNS